MMRDAAQRWFLDALRHAKNGDANQAALLAEMLKQGYGCVLDEEEARYWKQVARNAGGDESRGCTTSCRDMYGVSERSLITFACVYRKLPFVCHTA